MNSTRTRHCETVIFRRSNLLLLSVLIWVSACQSAPIDSAPISTSPAKETATPFATATATFIPSPMPTIPQLIYPYTIDGLRHHDYKSGKLHIRAKLEETDLYMRYSIDYPSDGLTITGIMQIPKNGKPPFPVVVMNHGFFPRASYSSGDGTYRAAEYLNKYGYLTLSPDYRSWGGSDVGPSLFYSGLVIDVINLLNAIPSIPEADATRVGMWGHSMGGGVTMRVLTIVGGRVTERTETSVKAAVLYSTVSADEADILARWGLGCIGDIAAGEQQLGCNSSDVVPLSLPANLRQAYYDASTNADLLHQISSFYHLDLVTAPVEINYGTADGKTLAGAPPDWSKKLYQGLVEAKRVAKLFAYEDEGHSFNGDLWLAFMDRSVKFFDKYVKNMP